MEVPKGWVYVIEAIKQELFKVGYTMADPDSRLKQLQTGCPHKLDLLCAFKCAYPAVMETTLHIVFDREKWRVQGEWFNAPKIEMLDCLMHFFAGIAHRSGAIEFRSSSLREP